MKLTKSLYPKTFLHFTDKKSKLESILTNGYFRPSYARETIYNKDGIARRFGIPMVSFCNIRLSLLSEHTKKYGHYGIGLNDDWASKNNLNPVLYMSRYSDVFTLLDQQIRKFKNDKDIANEYSKNNDYQSLINILRYMKNHTGPLTREGKKEIDYCFADEMEWRFVPTHQEGIIPIALLSKINSTEEKNKYNDKIRNIHLDFGINDIKYIILKDKSQLSSFIKNLDKNGLKVNNELISKIFYSSQINDDL
ncbi:hypothetical protein OD218_000545 [Salmonella enterica]|uniref:abortive infection system antitoxin AbiGi family protein n=1 Tax=Klebsiella pasteurii TaxID=2587529 RepID=UPI00292D4BBE|nr:abortive infection system antitoxin AbiGi family protein [Klebsiella pasteurii]EJX3082851.1 hypothetical protein [Salmonella enterica]EJX3102595.1 hypothetical protein [Salmonella enterica]EJX3112664.1 hypothetical protein [Salmonella enterica]EJX3246926.1 hypothetical protein [Salmonella enterica]EJX3461608.1 hypothetical protein [Salmonella enterica]